MSPERDPRRAAAETLGVDGAAGGSIELWTKLAFLVLATALVGVLYLGTRPGGYAPIWVWGHGRFFLVALAFLLALFGLAWSFTHKPFLSRRRGRGFVALVLVIGGVPLPMPYPSSRENAPSTVPFTLPLAGEWTVHSSGAQGGPLSAFTADRRFGLHFVHPADLEREEDGAAQEYEAFGAEVLAPSAGKVAWLREDLPDRDRPTESADDTPELGNVLFIEVADGEFLVLGHLAQDSIQVEVGDEVSPGQVVARIGSSGRFKFTPIPHLSAHLQTSPEEGRGEPIPWEFRGYWVEDRQVERGVPLKGDRVRPDERP